MPIIYAIMAILVLGKCSANFGPQILGKALEFPGKRLQKSLPECCFTLDTDFDWLKQKNKPRKANFPIENIAHERCNVLSRAKGERAWKRQYIERPHP